MLQNKQIRIKQAHLLAQQEAMWDSGKISFFLVLWQEAHVPLSDLAWTSDHMDRNS